MNAFRDSESGRRTENVQKQRILLVDDEPAQRMLMGRVLTRAGYEVETAENGREALEKLRTGMFHTVVTDWEMPEMDGLALCRAIRSMSFEFYIFTIMVTSRDAVEHVVMGLEAGADDYLVKPVIEPELVARLHTGRRLKEMEAKLSSANAESRRLAYSHPLTEVFNRLHLMERLPQELDHAIQYKRPLSMIICDIDQLREVNNKHGHIAGSCVLVAVAKLLQRQSEIAGGWVAHHGGDEFAIVLPNTTLTSAHAFADSARIELSEECIPLGSGNICITASFGISGWDRAVPRGAKADKLWQLADRCVFQSKSAGRNRVAIMAVPRSNPRR